MAKRISALVGVTILLVLSMQSSRNVASGKPTLSTTVVAVSCSSMCVQNRNFCNSTCNGDPTCLAECQEEYDCCLILCHNGVCRQAKPHDTASAKKPK